jgi:hypothetical protein
MIQQIVFVVDVMQSLQSARACPILSLTTAHTAV